MSQRYRMVVVPILVLFSTPVFAQNTTAPDTRISFFVTSVGIGKGGNLGGLAGADQHCQTLAASVGAGSRTWHAYLSTEAQDGHPAINARDRIGTGPWYNERKARIAKDVADLHGDTLDAARLGNNITRDTALTEQGEMVKGLGERPNRHDVLTGSRSDGKAFTDGMDHTCQNWTSTASTGGAQVGHTDRTGGGNTSWNSTHNVKGCGLEDFYLEDVHGGLFYCFAVN
jgi:hypothetical protein